MKNTALALTSSTVATLSILTGIYAVNSVTREYIFQTFWKNFW